MTQSPNSLASNRLKIRYGIKNHNKLQSLLYSLYKLYYSSTGNLHNLPNYLIIGAAKCGTSSLYEYLTQHPSINPALGKEINFFDMHYSKGINWYRSYFPFKNFFTKKNSITGEATPRYLDHPHAAKRVYDLIPSVKIIVLLRNPVDRAYSHWNMMVAHKREDLSFSEAIENEKSRISDFFEQMQNNKEYYSKDYFWYGYLERGLYAKKIKHWMNFIPKEQFLVLQSEDFFRNTSDVYNHVLEFLDLPKRNLIKYDKFRKGSYKKQKMDNSTRKNLIDFFKPHNEELYNLLGENFHWED